MHFDQRIHAPAKSRIFQLGGLCVRDRGHDDQYAIGSERAGFGHLVGVIHKVFAQGWHVGCGTRGDQKVLGTLKRRSVGQNGQTSRAAVLIGFGKRCRFEIGTDQTLGRRGFLDFGNQPVTCCRSVDQTGCKRAHRICGLGCCFDLGQGARGFVGGNLFELIGFDLVENGRRHASVQLTSVSPLALSHALTFEKGREPKKPRRAESGDGCAVFRMK